MNEFELIRHYFTRPPKHANIRMGVGDDGAIVEVSAQEKWVFCMDTLVCGRHFPEDAPPESVGWKALAVNLSDLAAMGATPKWFQLALTLPEMNPQTQNWLTQFAQGLWACADEFNVDLIGGDTTRGALSITIQAAGIRPYAQTKWHRHDAQIGDLLCVTGTIGDAGLGLKLWQNGDRSIKYNDLYERLHRPVPRVIAAQKLAKTDWIHAAIDVSDGLLSEIWHICEKSQFGAKLFVENIPRSLGFSKYYPDFYDSLGLNAGDDYELLLSIAPQNFTKAQKCLAEYGLSLSHFGVIVPCQTDVSRITLYPNQDNLDKSLALPAHIGFQHFS